MAVSSLQPIFLGTDFLDLIREAEEKGSFNTPIKQNMEAIRMYVPVPIMVEHYVVK